MSSYKYRAQRVNSVSNLPDRIEDWRTTRSFLPSAFRAYTETNAAGASVTKRKLRSDYGKTLPGVGFTPIHRHGGMSRAYH